MIFANATVVISIIIGTVYVNVKIVFNIAAVVVITIAVI